MRVLLALPHMLLCLSFGGRIGRPPMLPPRPARSLRRLSHLPRSSRRALPPSQRRVSRTRTGALCSVERHRHRCACCRAKPVVGSVFRVMVLASSCPSCADSCRWIDTDRSVTHSPSECSTCGGQWSGYNSTVRVDHCHIFSWRVVRLSVSQLYCVRDEGCSTPLPSGLDGIASQQLRDEPFHQRVVAPCCGRQRWARRIGEVARA